MSKQAKILLDQTDPQEIVEENSNLETLADLDADLVLVLIRENQTKKIFFDLQDGDISLEEILAAMEYVKVQLIKEYALKYSVDITDEILDEEGLLDELSQQFLKNAASSFGN